MTPARDAVEELSIGLVEGDPNYTFAFVTDIAVAQNGWMLILDAPAFRGRPVLRLYTDKGQFVRNVGGQGRGPGEFVQPTSVAVMPDGRFLLLDPMLRRLNVYNATGQHIETWTVPLLNVVRGVPGIMRISPQGVISIRFNVSQNSTSAADIVMTQGVIRMRPGGTVIDTLTAPVLPNLSTPVRKIRKRGTAQIGIGFSMPFVPGSVWQYSPLGYFVTARSDRYALDLRVPPNQGHERLQVWRGGDPVLSIRLSGKPVRISRKERADQQAFIEERLREVAGVQNQRVPTTPAIKPFFQGLYVGDEGRLWVKIHVESKRDTPLRQSSDRASTLRWREASIYDVFEPSGSYVGRVQAHDGLRILKYMGDRFWAVSKNDLDVEIVKQYRVKWN